MREKKKNIEGRTHTGHVTSLPTLGVITALVLHIATFVHVNLTFHIALQPPLLLLFHFVC